jgi:2-oxoglutarate dehydrogenase complex dehydrogenase (E1) component-like enzyme
VRRLEAIRRSVGGVERNEDGSWAVPAGFVELARRHDALRACGNPVRVELLSPLPHAEINDIIATYPNLKKIVWVQEEPKNMGARAYFRRRLIERKRDKLEIDYVGRPYRASPSEGYPGAHAVEQERLLKEALTE